MLVLHSQLLRALSSLVRLVLYEGLADAATISQLFPGRPIVKLPVLYSSILLLYGVEDCT